MRTYCRAEDKDSRCVQKQRDMQYEDWYDDRDSCGGDCAYCLGTSITMEVLNQGRLLTLLAKLRIRGSQDALSNLYW